jgi:hypothetical protein
MCRHGVRTVDRRPGEATAHTSTSVRVDGQVSPLLLQKMRSCAVQLAMRKKKCLTSEDQAFGRSACITQASRQFGGVTDGARTHDNQNHNLGLYQLSYSHHESSAV